MTENFIGEFYSDCLILTNYIEELEFYDNKRRKHINKNKGETWSMLYGLTPYNAYKKGFYEILQGNLNDLGKLPMIKNNLLKNEQQSDFCLSYKDSKNQLNLTI